MLRLRTFGAVELLDDEGRELGTILAQPKRLALLTYLAAARPQGSHRRDRLLALFWPELDDERARDALNQALRFLRQAVGAETLPSRGGDEVGVDPARLWCDAVAFRGALDAGRPAEALELYRGDFLQGFFIDGGEGFEEWVERERRTMRDSAGRSARELAEHHAAEGAFTQAIAWGRKALELGPDDERALRRLIHWYDQAGDRAGALRAYEGFVQRLDTEFGVGPSPETEHLGEALRAGRALEEPRGTPRRPTSGSPGSAGSSDMFGERYRIVRRLGAGGMATVFLAQDLKHDREVALKVLRPEIAQGLARERFVREILIAGRLQHPNIVPLFDSGESEGRLYYVMPHVVGETLRDRLNREGRLPVEEAVHVLREMAGALAYAHAQGVVHRDIKPDNVLLMDGRAVVADFGIARAAHAARTPNRARDLTLTQPGTSLGTPAYMAPEQALGDEEIDHRADLYALGVVGYEMLAGRTPFQGATAQELLAAQLTGHPAPILEFRPELPAALGPLIMQCLEKDPAARPRGARDLVGALASISSPAAVPPLPALLLGGPAAFWRALLVYLGLVVLVGTGARLATSMIGLPEWVFPGALFLMALGLPVVLFLGYVQYATRRALASAGARAPGVSPRPLGTLATLAVRAGRRVSWKRALLGGAGALAAFVLLTAGYMGMRAAGIGPAGTLTAAGKLKERPRLLVADVTVRSADSALAGAVQEAVRAGLGDSKALTLMQPRAVADALQRMRVPSGTPVDLALARQVAAREGVAAIVDAELTGLGAGFLMTLRLVSADSGNVLASYQQTARRPDELIPTVDAVARKLRGKIGESLRDVHASKPLMRLTTSSLEALKLYVRAGVERNNGNTGKAIALYRQALALDSGFAIAWQSLSVVLRNNRFPPEVTDPIVARAYELRDRLQERERMSVTAIYFIGPGQDGDRALDAYDQLLAAGDSQSGNINNMGMLYKAKRDWARSELAFKTALRLQGRPGGAMTYNLPIPLFAQGKLAEIDTLMAERLRKAPLDGSWLFHTRIAMYQRGDLAEYERVLDSAFASTDGKGGRGPIVTQGTALVLELRGRLREATARWAEMVRLDSSMGIPHSALADSLRAIQYDIWFRQQSARAVARLDEVMARFPIGKLYARDRVRWQIPSMYAAAGRADKARALLAQLGLPRDSTHSFEMRGDHQVPAEMALAEGNPQRAIAEFRAADGGENPLTVLANLGRGFDAAGQTDSAIAMFEAFFQTRYWLRISTDASHPVNLYQPSDAVFAANLHRRLGELYEARGDRPNAARHFRAFVSLWEHADPELQPQVVRARQALRRLAEQEGRHQP